MNLNDLWSQIPQPTREIVTRVVLALLVLLLIWLLRRLLTGLVVAPLRRILPRFTWGEPLLEIITLPARLVIIAFGLAVGAEILQIDPATNSIIQTLIRSLLILAIFVLLYRAVNALAPTSAALLRMTGLSIHERLLPFIRTVAKLVVVALAIVVVMQEWGYDVTGLVAGLGLGGLAFSLAAKDTVENLFGFTNIVGDQPFVVGDYIKTSEVEGTVEKVGVRSTRIRQLDQSLVTVPNGKLASSTVTNWSRLNKRWVNLTLRITYDARRAEIERLLVALRELLGSRSTVESSSIIVRFVGFGDMGYEILVRCYILKPDWADFTTEQQDVYLDILRLLERLRLHLSFPARTFLNEAPPESAPTEQAIPGGPGGPSVAPAPALTAPPPPDSPPLPFVGGTRG
jgi:MscS family membrane protein